MRSVVVVVGAALAFGCVTSPVGPRGPLVGPSMRLGASWAAEASHGELRSGSSVTRGPSDSVWAPFTLLPRYAELRAAPVAWADLGGSLGWLDANVDVRFGVPALPRRVWAGNVALGFRSGALAILDDAKPARSAWGRFELYPLLAERETFLGTRAHRGLLALGLNAGRFFHELSLPPEEDYDGDGFSRNVVDFTRKELRIEGALGYVRHDRQSLLLLALEPYVAIDRGGFRCGGGCSFRQIWGVALVFDVNVFLGLQSQETAH